MIIHLDLKCDNWRKDKSIWNYKSKYEVTVTWEPEPIHGSLPRKPSTSSVYSCSFGVGAGAP